MHALILLLDDARRILRSDGERVRPEDVARLEAELGRPLPLVLKWTWQAWGCGELGGLYLSGPREISAGIALSDRLLDEALLPFASSPDGDPLGLRLGAEEDPEVVLALDFPQRLRAPLGRLSAAVQVAVLDALAACPTVPEEQRLRYQTRLARLDPDRRFRDPASWAAAPPVQRASGG